MLMITEKGKPDTIMNYINYSVTPDTIKEATPIQVRWLGHVYRKDERDPAENQPSLNQMALEEWDGLSLDC
jgi:hypothetical protein